MSASVSEQRDRGPFSTDVLATLTLFLLVLLNPAALQVVRPTPVIPALTSWASASLSFVFLTPPAASRQPPRAPGAPGLSLDPVSTSEFREKSGGTRSLLTFPVCFLAGAGPRVRLLPVQVASASWRLNAAAPSPFCLSSNICLPFHGSPLHTPILSAGDVHL